MDDWEYKGRTAVEYRRIKNFIELLSKKILREPIVLEASYALSSSPIPLRETFDLARVPIAEGAVWGKTWDSGYFKLSCTVPKAWHGKTVAAWVDLGGEGLFYDDQGQPLYGITNGSTFDLHYSKDVWVLDSPAHGGQKITLWVEAAANHLLGLDAAAWPLRKDEPRRHGSFEAKIRCMRIALFDEKVWHLYLDMRHLVTLYEGLDPATVRATRILRALFTVTSQFHDQANRADLCRQLLNDVMGRHAHASALSVTAVGHAHIDTAWLWRISETKRKIARTWASQLSLLDRYPAYVFGASAPQHYEWLKEDYPGLFERVKKAVASGRWELQGGMWIEADCNLPSGESLIRQILHGKNYWKDEFGVEIRNCWIPDVFGYAASLPQILRKSGIDSFLTQKLSWSKFNEFPHDTFRWRGIDGSEVLTHFPPEYTYNSTALPSALLKAEKNFHEKAFIDEFIALVGIGDGGGGPKEEHIEYILRSENLEGLPKAQFGRADELFARLQKHGAELDVWSGELYLEYHRGTYTTQAAIKKQNRQLEQAIRATEILWSCLPIDQYPAAELDRIVKIMLLHQFHDILPGSSIHTVYDDANLAYTEAFSSLAALQQRASGHISIAEPEAITFFNSLSIPWRGLVLLPHPPKAQVWKNTQGTVLETQAEPEGIVAFMEIAPLSFETVRAAGSSHGVGSPQLPGVFSKKADPLVLENDLIRYTFNPTGELLEVWDKQAARSILKPGRRGNVLSYYEDTPHMFDAWDIDFYYPAQLLETARPVRQEILTRGPVRQGTRFVTTVGNSTISQDVWLAANTTKIEFHTTVQWNESQRLLRVSFPLDLQAREALCDIAYGTVSQPTHRNTSWDFAKFEICAHRWVDISDATYGVALLNDCKYGYSVQDNVLGLSLLRSPLYPDPDADTGIHTFVYALLPHTGPLAESTVRQQAAVLNTPVLRLPGALRTDVRPPIGIATKGICLEVIKKAEKESAWIIRLVETSGGTSTGVLTSTIPHATIQETDLMEWANGATIESLDGLSVTLSPFEIRTYKVFVHG